MYSRLIALRTTWRSRGLRKGSPRRVEPVCRVSSGPMLDQLLASPGVAERLVTGSRFGFCALHGGLEQGTAEIAEAAAAAAGASFYAVVQPDNLRWHVPSHRYDPTCSAALRGF